MKDSYQKLVFLLWTVIAVVFIGAAIGGYLLTNKTNQLQTSNDELNGNVTSLRDQLRQAKASPPPTSAPLPDASGKPTTTPTPTPSPTASAQPKL